VPGPKAHKKDKPAPLKAAMHTDGAGPLS